MYSRLFHFVCDLEISESQTDLIYTVQNGTVSKSASVAEKYLIVSE